MKRSVLSILSVFSLLSVSTLFAEPNIYKVPFEEKPPYGVSAWHQSERVRKGIGKETRFSPYNKDAAGKLADDALVDRGGKAEISANERETAFWQAYDDKGWYIYIESKEPLVKDLVNQLVNPRSAGKKELYEIFFTPGLYDVPYYQMMTYPYKNETRFFDWGMPHEHYRSLKTDAHLESLALENGVGTFVFIPWHLVYENIPYEGGEWRFTIIRWMPFAKAGGVTWGGRVHETGNFGRIQFEKPEKAQREAIESRLLQYAWYRFQAISDQKKESWSDPHTGDPEFYQKILAPEIERLSAIGEKWGDPGQWTPQQVKEGLAHLKEFMEFDYRTSALRTKYIQNKLLSQK